MRLTISSLGAILTLLLIVAAVTSVTVSVRTTNGVLSMRGAWVYFEQGAGRKTELLDRLNAALGYGGMIHQFKDYVLTRNPEMLTPIRETALRAQQVISDYRKLSTTEKERNALDVIDRDMIDTYLRNLDLVEAMAAEDATSEVINSVLLIDDTPPLESLRTLYDEISTAQKTSSLNIGEVSDRVANQSRIGALAIAASLGIVILVLVWFMALRLVKPLKNMTSAMEHLAEGKLDVEIPETGRRDEIGKMATAVEVFKDNATRIIAMETDADAIIRSILGTSEQVRGVVGDQVATSNSQASAVSETSTSLEEIRETAGQTENRVNGLKSAAENTLRQGEEGRRNMANVIDAMNEIRDRVQAIAHTMMVLSEQTRRVGEITDSVGVLAQQSKMLAINASIEASKAGDAGRGFAVVAQEVASLAQQSEQATRQVRDVLGQIQNASEKAILATEEGTKQVDLGVELIEVTGRSIDSLTEIIGETVDATREIVDSIVQQTSGIQQITGAMSDIGEGTRVMVDGANEISTAIEGLTAKVADLVRSRSK